MGAASTTAAPAAATPVTPSVEITGITEEGGRYRIAFRAHAFSPALDEGTSHAHFFWDTTPRATAGTNGRPQPGQWLAYAGASPAVDDIFAVDNRPAGATAICALVGTHHHAIADVDGDGAPDPDSGNCASLPS